MDNLLKDDEFVQDLLKNFHSQMRVLTIFEHILANEDIDPLIKHAIFSSGDIEELYPKLLYVKYKSEEFYAIINEFLQKTTFNEDLNAILDEYSSNSNKK